MRVFALAIIVMFVLLCAVKSHNRVRTTVWMIIIYFDYHIGSPDSRFQHLPIMCGVA